MNTLSDEQLTGLLGFIGYGNPQARLRFMGAEEGLGGAMSPTERSKNLMGRCGWRPVEDLAEAHLTLWENGKPIDIEKPRTGSTICWRFMARIARAVQGEVDFLHSGRAAEYMRYRLGRKDGCTFLTELNPIPAKRSGQPEELAQFGDAERIWELLRDRERTQLQILNNTVGITICFGLSKRERFARRLGLAWQPIAGKCATGSDGLTFLVPYLGNGQMSEAMIASFVLTPEFTKAVARVREASRV